MIILTKRPEDMSFDKYKTHLKKQKEWLKQRTFGVLFYKAAEILKVGSRTYSPFMGCVKDLKKPILSDRSIRKHTIKQQER